MRKRRTMMPRYRVTTTILSSRETDVEADNEDEAKELALRNYYDRAYDCEDDEFEEPVFVGIEEITGDEEEEDDDA
jgi:DNA polymerase II large subunit